MGDTILLRRGTAANLPDLQEGEPGWATDTKQLYIGVGAGTSEKSRLVNSGGIEYFPDPNVANQDSTDDADSILSILGTIGTTNKATIVLQKRSAAGSTYTVGTDADWSSYTNVTFKIVPGAVISHGAFTVVLPDTPDAGRYQIFAGTGAVTGPKWVYPEWFGAKGDSATDDYAAFAAATLSFPSTQSGFRRGTIVLSDESTYIISQEWTVPNNISIKGPGWGSILSYTGTAGYLLNIGVTTWTSETARRGGSYQGFQIKYGSGTGAAGGMLVGCSASGNSNLFLKDIFVEGFNAATQHGIAIGNTYGTRFEGVYSLNNYDNLVMETTYGSTTISFNSCQFRSAARYGVRINKASGVEFTGQTIIESNESSGMLVSAAAAISGVVLDGVWFEANNVSIAGRSMYLVGDGSNNIFNVSIKNTSFAAGGAATTGALIYDYVRDLYVSNCHFPEAAAPNYDVTDSGHNYNQTWIGNDAFTTVSGLDRAGICGTNIDSQFPTLKIRDRTNSSAGAWGYENIAVQTVDDDAVAVMYSATTALVGIIQAWADFAQAWAVIFVYWDGATASYEAVATGTKAEIVNALPTTGTVTDGKIGIGIYKGLTNQLRIDILNRCGAAKTVGVKTSGAMPF